MKFESSMESLIPIGRSESFAESLNSEFNKFGSAQFLGESFEQDQELKLPLRLSNIFIFADYKKLPFQQPQCVTLHQETVTVSVEKAVMMSLQRNHLD